MLIGSMGILSALLQGGYVRKVVPKVGEAVIARSGVFSCFLGLLLLSVVPHLMSKAAVGTLRLSAVFMAYTSATVVNSLTSYASLQCDDIEKDHVTGKPKDEQHPDLAKGKALGRFRSRGQLGRAIGPLLGMWILSYRLFLSTVPSPNTLSKLLLLVYPLEFGRSFPSGIARCKVCSLFGNQLYQSDHAYQF